MRAILRRVPTQQRAKQKYDAILNASIVVLAREGYDRSNTSKIAAEAGISIGSLYEYFPNKESIFTAFLDSRIEGAISFIKQSAKHAQKDIFVHSQQDNVAPAALLAWLKIGLQATLGNRDLLRVLINEIPGVMDLFSLKDFEKQLLPLAKFLSEDKQFNDRQLKIKTYILSNALYGFMLRSIFSDNDLTIDEIAEELCKLITAYAGA